jgi:hypothetical protein
MMDLAMNFDTDECLVTAMFDKGNRNDTMEAIDHIIPFLKGDADMIGLVCNTIRKLFCMSDEGYAAKRGKYLCCFSRVSDTPSSRNAKICRTISEK